jgi:hypothetical protein
LRSAKEGKHREDLKGGKAGKDLEVMFQFLALES